jgi:hypothetical protein
MSFSVYPAVEGELFDGVSKLPSESNHLFTRYILTKQSNKPKITIKKFSEESKADKKDYKEWSIRVPKNAMNGIDDLFLCINYVGDTASVYINGKLVADNFYNGLPWTIGLKRFLPEIFHTGLVVRIKPMQEQAQIYMEDWVKSPKGKEPGIEKIEILPEYSAIITNSQPR